MAQEIIDFGNFSRKITLNPIVPLQLLQLKYRNSQRVQATIIGKVYSSHIDILDIVPVSLSQQHKIKTLDFVQHQKNVENILTVYPTLTILGVAVTDLQPNINLAALHTMYINKESGFKAQGILNFPIILSVGSEFNSQSKNFQLSAYSYSQTYRFCKDVMDVTAFQKLDVSISLGESDFQSMTPLFEAFNDQERIVPQGRAQDLMKVLAIRLKQLKLRCEKQKGEELKVQLREITSKIGAKQCLSTEQLSYLLEAAGLQKRIAIKMNKIL